MTFLAVVVENLVKGCTFTEVTPTRFESARETAECGVQAGLVEECNITMTDSTALFWVGYYSDMSSVFLFGTAITAVTDYTADLAMFVF